MRYMEHSEQTSIHSAETSSLKAAWAILKSQSNLHSPIFRHAVRMAIIAGVCCLLVHFMARLHLNDNDLSLGYWVLLTAVFICQPNYSATQSKLLHRIIGTVGGVIVGSLMALIPMSLAVKITIAVIALVLFFFCRTNKYSYSTFFITIQAMMGFAIMGFDVSGFFVPRIIDTLLGAAVSGTAVYALWADWKYISLEKVSVSAMHSNAAYLQAVLQELQTGISDNMDYRLARRNSHEKAAALSSVLSDMSSDADKHGDKLETGFQLLKINYSIISYISALGAYRDKIQRNNAHEQHFLDAFYTAAQQLVHILQHMAEWDKTHFQAAFKQLEHTVKNMQNMATPDENGLSQNQVLSRQVLMLAELLPACYETMQPKAA